MVREFLLVRRTSEFVSPKPEGTQVLATAETLEDIGEFVAEKTGEHDHGNGHDPGPDPDPMSTNLHDIVETDGGIDRLLEVTDDGA